MSACPLANPTTSECDAMRALRAAEVDLRKTNQALRQELDAALKQNELDRELIERLSPKIGS